MDGFSIAFEAFRKEIYGIKNQAKEFKVSQGRFGSEANWLVIRPIDRTHRNPNSRYTESVHIVQKNIHICQGLSTSSMLQERFYISSDPRTSKTGRYSNIISRTTQF